MVRRYRLLDESTNQNLLMTQNGANSRENIKTIKTYGLICDLAHQVKHSDCKHTGPTESGRACYRPLASSRQIAMTSLLPKPRCLWMAAMSNFGLANVW